MKTIKTITDPEAFQLLADETRRKIVFLLRVKEMTVSQIAEQLDLSPQAVYHHIKKLQKGDLVEVVREERLGHLIESYYRTTAETFNLSVGKTSTRTPKNRKLAKQREAEILDALKKLGFNVKYDESNLDQLVDLRTELNQCCGLSEYEDKLSNMEDLDFITKIEATEYAETISMSEEEFVRLQEIKKKLRKLLKSLVK
ncbi:winged helix-turn-helix transcriptional regulator [Candidatus Bathyarchaeota archaeon]|nr:winged helix-turn-helix transcriptional regulator [Candidatus Bathyarchaeota archaeon]